MKRANSSLDVKNIQVALETFNMEVEKQNIMQGIKIILFSVQYI